MSMIRHAMDEMKRAGFEQDDIRAMKKILSLFFAQWDSGGAVWAMAPVLQKLIAGKCITPLTGENDEWNEVGMDSDGHPIWQNRRVSSVFRDHTGLCYDLDHPKGREARIVFPYLPKSAEVNPPVMEIEL